MCRKRTVWSNAEWLRRKRRTALLMAAAVLMGSFPAVSVQAEEEEAQVEKGEEEVASVEDANETIASYKNEETAWEEVYIGNAEELKAFSRDCWLDTWSQNKKVYLTADIDLSGEGFVSIPTFGGYFDGQGHTISGFLVRKPVSYVGLFNYTQKTAVIANLKVEGTVRPTGTQLVVGGIVGDNSGILLNCVFDGDVEAGDYVGGLTGYNEISGVLMDSEALGVVTGAHYTGGIAGDNVGNIVGCVNRADVNVSSEDKAKSLEDIDLGQYTAGLFGSQEGCGAFRIRCFGLVSIGILLCAGRPQSRYTIGLSSSFTARITASVNSSHPFPWWEFA